VPRVVFPPEVAMHVVHLACERPETLGRSLSPWDGAELARQLIAYGQNIGTHHFPNVYGLTLDLASS
jgi:hypothetical protein